MDAPKSADGSPQPSPYQTTKPASANEAITIARQRTVIAAADRSGSSCKIVISGLAMTLQGTFDCFTLGSREARNRSGRNKDGVRTASRPRNLAPSPMFSWERGHLVRLFELQAWWRFRKSEQDV